MKMADGGYRPAYDVQFSTDTETQVIVGVAVNNQGNDKGQLGHMQEQLEVRYGFRPKEALVDGGYVQYTDFEQVSQQGTVIYAPLPNIAATNQILSSRNLKIRPVLPPGVSEWQRKWRSKSTNSGPQRLSVSMPLLPTAG